MRKNESNIKDMYIYRPDDLKCLLNKTCHILSYFAFMQKFKSMREFDIGHKSAKSKET